MMLAETTQHKSQVLDYPFALEDHISDALSTPTASRHDIASPVLLHYGVIGTPNAFTSLSLASPNSSNHLGRVANIRELSALESCLMRHYVHKLANMVRTSEN